MGARRGATNASTILSTGAIWLRERSTFKVVHTVGLDDDQVHAPNEKFSMSSYHGGIRSVAYLYEELARGA